MTAMIPWPGSEIGGGMALGKAAGIFLATFVWEDAAAVGAGWLLAAGALSWPVAYGACFLGIWMGDAGLYALARLGGRRWFEQSSFRRFSAPVARCEEWFARRRQWALILSRGIPGARLPIYLASGFLRIPLLEFLALTGAAALVWTLLILWLAETTGARAVHWLGACQHGGLLLAVAGAALFAGFHWLRRRAAAVDWRAVTGPLERWRHWEFWPAWFFYPPVVLYCVWLAVKYRGLTVPTAANPGIFSGGLVGESKMAMLQSLAQTSPEFTAAAGLVTGGDFAARARALAELRRQLDLPFPFILKPDLGQRGAGVKLIRTQEQAEDYLCRTTTPLVAQRYAPGPLEAGIFYYRFPQEARGRIFAITDKVFPILVGDGRHTVAELVAGDARARLIADIYLKRFASRRREVLPAGQSIRLVEAGNHAQGCLFRDGWRLWSPRLEARLDEISQKLEGFFIGRYDIRYASENELRDGRAFQIVELNGAGAEATSIYDARNSLWSAYGTLFRQWELVFAIGAANRRRGVATADPVTVWQAWRRYSRLAATYPEAD